MPRPKLYLVNTDADPVNSPDSAAPTLPPQAPATGGAEASWETSPSPAGLIPSAPCASACDGAAPSITDSA
ncbi:hypothetical protein CYD53_10549 [Bosea psychrotolerans]|uniref:Uncharacterized protein n=1 Tax=Bosea psychrotolerans TaxID=1871628 RepID=A0A2S4MCE7_9HYPH|nr:hypothetical protein CYD53_10549 [Bosea psychrotolerans]